MPSKFLTIAKYERKVLLRSWFFRIFSILTLFMIFVFNMAEISNIGDGSWVYRAVPSNMPYLAVYLLNIGQAIIAVFLSSEFIKRDRKQDTAEVFYVRSMSNATYVLGKAWSILSIFLLVNLVALILAVIFNALADNTHIDWQAYLYYPLLISVPTLVFIIGLTSLMMSIIRNQALTFVLLIGYILSSLIYLQASHNYLFDYMAFHMPLFHSQITGFGDWEAIWMLRSMYTCFGLGFIFLSVLLLNRLAQSRIQNIIAFFLAISFIGGGIYLASQHMKLYQKSVDLPLEMIALNDEFLSSATIDIDQCELFLTQEENGISVVSQISGSSRTDAKEFVFNLNPGLRVHEITSEGKSIDFERKTHLLFIKFDSILAKGAAVTLNIEYSGSIDEDAMFIDVDPDLKFIRPDDYLYDIGKQYVYISPDFLLLTPEAHWYLQSGVTYCSKSALWFRKDFIDYDLRVKTLPGLVPVSTGDLVTEAENLYSFDFEYALPQLSLSIGNYEKKSIRMDSLELSVYHIEGHDYFKDAFPDIRDTLPSIIFERLRDYERKIDLKYPFKEFSIVEVPGQFKSYDRTWTSVLESNQASLLYFPEKALFNRRNDFTGSVRRQKRWGRNREKTQEEMQITVLYQFLDIFYRFKDVDTRSNPSETVVLENINPFYQFVQFYEMCNNLDSDEWPILNRIFESYLRGSEGESPEWVRRNSGSTQNELANMILQEKSFAEVLNLTENKELIDNVVELKGETLFSMIEAKSNTNRFRDFIGQILEENRFRNYPFTEFNQSLRDEFGIDIAEQMDSWFNEIQLSKYRITTPIAEKVLAGNREMVQVSFAVSNNGDAEGVIKISLKPGDEKENLLYLDAGQSKEVFYLSSEDPTSIKFNTLSSGNLPNQIEYSFEQIGESKEKNASERELEIDNIFVVKNENEYIFDNEGSEFDFTQFAEVSRLRKWLKPIDNEGFRYQGTKIWRPPLNWTATTNDNFYGEFIRSAFYIKAGDGSKEAKWQIPLPEPGRYDVYYHVYKDQSFNWDSETRGNYEFTIPHQGGVDKPKIELSKNSPEGWTALGDYSFSEDTITISLSNETKLRAIFADAIKLVKQD